MKAAYFDCFAGASGDMILGALVDAGLPIETLARELARMPLQGYRLTARPARRGAIAGTQVMVEEEGQAPPLGLKDVLALVEGSGLPLLVKEKAALAFRRLAAAEARVHGTRPEEAPFHEVGALDAIVDVVGALLGLHLLGVEQVYASPLPSGGGTVESSHGTLPIPAPATLELMALAKAPMRPTRLAGLPLVEMVTPTGAAVITTVAAFQEPILILERVGYGVGSRDLPELPNVLPLWLGETAKTEERELFLLETNIDDMSPEVFGYVLERLLDQGARDVWFTPIQMKKNRPATMVSVLVGGEARATVLQTLFRETSTLGVRVQPIQRHEAEREQLRFVSSLGEVSVKLKRLRGTIVGVSPEYDDCRRLALGKGLPLLEVYRVVEGEARRQLLG